MSQERLSLQLVESYRLQMLQWTSQIIDQLGKHNIYPSVLPIKTWEPLLHIQLRTHALQAGESVIVPMIDAMFPAREDLAPSDPLLRKIGTPMSDYRPDLEVGGITANESGTRTTDLLWLTDSPPRKFQTMVRLLTADQDDLGKAQLQVMDVYSNPVDYYTVEGNPLSGVAETSWCFNLLTHIRTHPRMKVLGRLPIPEILHKEVPYCYTPEQLFEKFFGGFVQTKPDQFT